jgi:hypothetical protein
MKLVLIINGKGSWVLERMDSEKRLWVNLELS